MFSAEGFMLVNGSTVVDELMIQMLDHLAHHTLQLDEIHQQSDAVQLLAFHGDLDAVVVAVHVFALPLYFAKRMAGGECLLQQSLQTLVAWRRLCSTSSQVSGERVVGQAVEEHLAVSLPRDAVVEDRKHAAIRPAADQPAEALLQRERGLRDLVLVKRIAAGFS